MKDINLTNNLKQSEIACKCGCGKNDIAPLLPHLFQKARDMFGKPILITSGCRCEKNNKLAGGKPDSGHLRGLALDLTCKDPNEFNLAHLNHCLTKAGFERIGLNEAKRFIHVDIDTSKPACFFKY